MPLDIYAVKPGSVIHYIGWNGTRTVTRFVLTINHLDDDELRVLCIRMVNDNTLSNRIEEGVFMDNDPSYELDMRYEHA